MNMTLSRQVLLGYAGAILALVAMIAVTLAALSNVAEDKDDIIENDVRRVVNAWRLKALLDEQALQIRGFLLAGDEQLLADGAEVAEEFASTLTEMAALSASEETQAILAEIDRSKQRWEASAEELLTQRRQPDADLAALGRSAQDRLIPARRQVRDAIDTLIARQEARIAEDVRASDEQVDRTRMLLVLLGLGAALAALTIGLWVTRTVRRRVQEMSAAIDAATSDILSGTAQQVEGSARQSAAVQETVATVEELERTADQSAERARGVADVAKRSADTADAGRHAIIDSTAGMEEIRSQVDEIAASIVDLAERAQSISEIVATVEDIADQTHLLALNAAIEAARAGEHGKGFSVVANEVRSLADESKRATAQVTDIISEIQQAMNAAVMVTEEGTKSVGRGVELITDAGGTIEELADTVASATLAAEQIAASAGQQAVATTQISQAMHDVRDATEQGLASSRQVESRARDLDAVAQELRRLVGNTQR